MFLILLVFSNFFPQFFASPPLPSPLSTHPFGFPPFCSSSLFAVSLPLWVFPYPFTVFPASLSVVLTCCLSTFREVCFHTLVFNWPVVFGALFWFFPLVICCVPIHLRFFIVWVLAVSLSVSRSLSLCLCPVPSRPVPSRLISSRLVWSALVSLCVSVCLCVSLCVSVCLCVSLCVSVCLCV